MAGIADPWPEYSSRRFAIAISIGFCMMDTIEVRIAPVPQSAVEVRFHRPAVVPHVTRRHSRTSDRSSGITPDEEVFSGHHHSCHNPFCGGGGFFESLPNIA